MTTLSKVSSYNDHNKRKRYRVHDVPSYFSVGEHNLSDGKTFNFDEKHTEETFKRTKELEDKNEIRPCHLNHWDFSKDKPDENCPNFGLMDNFQLTGKTNKIITHDMFDLTWTDLNKLEKLGGRSMQILNPTTNSKFDSIAFLPSLPPKCKGLGRIKLDLSEVTAPDDDDDKILSFMSIPEGNTEYAVNFSELAEKKSNQNAFILFQEEKMPDEFEKEDETEEIDDETELGGDDDIPDDDEVGDEVDDDDDDEVGNEMFEPEDEEPEPSADLPEEDEAMAVYLSEELDEKLEPIVEKVDEMYEMLKEMKMKADMQPPAAAPAAAAPIPSPVGFSEEKAEKVISAFFGESRKKVSNIADSAIGAHGEIIMNRSKPVVQKLIDTQEKISLAVNKRDEKAYTAAFAEQQKLIKDNIAPEINPPVIRTTEEKGIIGLYKDTLPAMFSEYPHAKKAWAEWNLCKRVNGKDGQTRNPANFQEWKTSKKDKIKEFVGYFNTVYSIQEVLDYKLPMPKTESEKK